MPFDQPSDKAVDAAYLEIRAAADEQPIAVPDPPAAIARLEALLRSGGNRITALQMQHTTGAWSPEALERLRALAMRHAADALSGLRACIASGDVSNIAMPTEGRLRSLVEAHGRSAPTEGVVEFLGEDPDQVLVEQFAMPVTMAVAPVALGLDSEDELVRSALGTIGAAAVLIAALEKRPALRQE